jgi:hypothetical protein
MNTVTQQVEYADVSEESIVDYLKSHPDFFERNFPCSRLSSPIAPPAGRFRRAPGRVAA